jgi:hypothetical protein
MALLSPQNQAILASINPSGVQASLASSRTLFASHQWLDLNNRYASDVVGEIARNIGPPPNQNAPHLAQYIAVSTLLHCSDGWSFLGRSINAMLNGDEGTALHLAYYAELRAAMSLLATQGIGAFNSRHFLIDGQNSVVAFPTGRGTHDFVWECLEAWADTTHASNLLGEIIAPFGIRLSSWASPLGAAPIIRLSGQEWLKEWGMDLARFSGDRHARNTTSYRPTGLEFSNNGRAEDATSFVRSMWSVLEPTTSSGFGNLDKFLLRSLLDMLVKGRYGLAALGQSDHQRVAGEMIAYQGGAIGDIAPVIQKFLLRLASADEPEILQYSPKSSTTGNDWHLSVISRSALLLRLATGATRRLFDQAGVQMTETAFWRDALGQRKGLWPLGSTPDPMSDLWADVEDGLRDFEEFEASVPAERSHYNLSKMFSSSVSELGKLERISVLNL